MPKWIPERPLYRRERLLVGYPVLAVFILLFLSRLFSNLFSLSASLQFSLLCLTAAFFVPSAIFWLLRGGGYTRALRLRAPRAHHLPFLLFAFLSLLSGAMLLSILCGGTSSLGNSATTFESTQTGGFWQTLGMALVLAVLPAILEEFFFRGIVAHEYERRGAARGVFMSALLFALCHFDIHNLPVYLFSGVLFALVLLATDSLLATMLLHVVYNIVSLFGQRYLNALYDFTGSLELFIFLLILVFLGSATLLAHAATRIYRRFEEAALPNPRRAAPWQVQLYTTLDALCDVPVVLCLILSIVGFIVL